MNAQQIKLLFKFMRVAAKALIDILDCVRPQGCEQQLRDELLNIEDECRKMEENP